MAVASGQAAQTLTERLQARRPEIEQTILTRVYSVSDPTEGGDPEYVAGLRAAVVAALDYSLGGIERGESHPAQIPIQLFAQVRHAARSGVSLDTVLRRYFAGYTLLGDLIFQEAAQGDLINGDEFQRAVRTLATIFDQLVVAISSEYAHETEGWRHSTEHRRAEHVRRLLAGDLGEAAEFGYEFDAWHLGVIARGPGAAPAIRDVAAAIDCRLLLVRPGEETIWAWLGGRCELRSSDLLQSAALRWPAEISLALGESGRGLSGWRLTHQQANTALPIATHGAQNPVRYADVALVASALGDNVLASSLQGLYLAPLERERDGGTALRQTLSAYFAAGRNVSSAAAALKVSRPTVKSRLETVEERIGRPLAACEAEIETALRLWDMRQLVPLRPSTFEFR